jgi:hypothetical protein
MDSQYRVESTTGLNRLETVPVGLASTKLPQEMQVSGSGIALMDMELIVREPFMVIVHQLVTKNLRENRGRGNGKGQGVALDNRPLWNREAGKVECIG